MFIEVLLVTKIASTTIVITISVIHQTSRVPVAVEKLHPGFVGSFCEPRFGHVLGRIVV